MVHATAVEGLKGRRLRVGMIGGGRNAFIGAVHRMAMRLDDLIELKAGALASDAENARASGADLGLAPDRIYSDYRKMAASEADQADPLRGDHPVARRGLCASDRVRTLRERRIRRAHSLSRRERGSAGRDEPQGSTEGDASVPRLRRDGHIRRAR